jgi:hypothetical protein
MGEEMAPINSSAVLSRAAERPGVIAVLEIYFRASRADLRIDESGRRFLRLERSYQDE